MPDRTMINELGNSFQHIDPENVTNGQLYSLLYAIRAQQIQSGLEVQALRAELLENKKSMADMHATWQTSQNVLKFIRILATVGLPLSVIWGFFKAIGVKFGAA